jgi:citrate lyase subunit beta/citryl-CoA lyase
MSSERNWHSYLFAPGSNSRLVGRALVAGAHAVVLDLEDGVAPDEKDRARDVVASALADSAVAGGPAIFVRVNGLATGRCRDDVEAVIAPALTGIRLPKVESAEEAAEVASWLPRNTVLDCTIESAAGVLAAREIAGADARVCALVFGAADFALDIGAQLTRDGRESFHVRSHLVLASAAAGKTQPVDGAFPWLDDPEGLEASARAARALGFGGKSAIHPTQLEPIHAAFAPSEADLEDARLVIDIFERARAEGSGVARTSDGRVIDEPIVEAARRALARAGLPGR